MHRTFILAAAAAAQWAVRVAADRGIVVDAVVTSPSTVAREAAATAAGGRWVFTIDEPLLAPRAPAESGADVLARLARALRGVAALDKQAPLVVVDSLDLLGAGVFVLDEHGLERLTESLEA